MNTTDTLVLCINTVGKQETSSIMTFYPSSFGDVEDVWSPMSQRS
jgi:hypothetical protein